MSRLEIFICVLSITSVVFLHTNAATSQKRSLFNNPERKLTEELEEANDEREMNGEGYNTCFGEGRKVHDNRASGVLPFDDDLEDTTNGEDAELIEEQYDGKGDNTYSPKEYSYHWIDDKDDAPLNSDLHMANDASPQTCRFYCRLICIRPCTTCRPICRLECRRVCFGK